MGLHLWPFRDCNTSAQALLAFKVSVETGWEKSIHHSQNEGDSRKIEEID